MEKNRLDFGNIDLIFKVTLRLRLLENGFSAPCLLKEWVYFDQTCITILFGHAKDLIRFGDHDPIFKVTKGLRMLESGLSAPYLMNKWMNFDQTCTAILL